MMRLRCLCVHRNMSVIVPPHPTAPHSERWWKCSDYFQNETWWGCASEWHFAHWVHKWVRARKWMKFRVRKWGSGRKGRCYFVLLAHWVFWQDGIQMEPDFFLASPSNLIQFGDVRTMAFSTDQFLGSPMHCPLMQNQITGFLDIQSWGFDSFTYGVPLVHLPFQKCTAGFVGPTNHSTSNLWKITILFMGKSSFLSSRKMELSIPMLNFARGFICWIQKSQFFVDC